MASSSDAAANNRSRAQRGKTHKSNGQGQIRKARHLDGRTREGRAARANAQRNGGGNV